VWSSSRSSSRALQGIGIGGEWGGSVLLAMEWNAGGRRGFVGSWPQFGVPVGLVLSNGVFLVVNALTGSQFLLDTKVALLVALAIVVSLPLQDMQYGPQAALIAESFTGRLRYSGASLGYQLASLIAGGPAPLVATALVAKFHSSLPVAIYVAAAAAIGFLATLGLKDNAHRDITIEYDDRVPMAEAKPKPAAG
jgi:hypothetical protein